ncbi:hypothetical protein SBRCBS47491_004714 [Sporothrix bragantina]|uniref:C2H2-type domain-containing protein n=1 Tax=Sporothrix bragantina TaxID=671064 RepID=A0ABP0BRB6_9PEZI
MESVMTNPMAPAAYYFYTPEQTVDARRHGSFLPQQPQVPSQQQFYYMMPATPTYSRPSSSSSQPQQVLMSQPQPLKPYVNGPISYPVVGSNARRSIVSANGKPTIMLETDFVDVDGLRLPSTPPLSSTASSTIGSPSACDMLATPLNPMFSGLDSFEAVKDASNVDVAAEQFNAAAWSNCASPPFAPVFIQAQSQSAKALAQTNGLATPTALSSDLLSVSACPSLSPSPSPYARSVASEQDNDFCDPRNLTVCGSEGSLSPTFSAVQAVPSPAAEVEDDFVLKSESTPAAAAVSPAPVANDFIPHLSVLEEFPDLESDDDFVNTLVNLGAEYSSASSIASADLSLRSRASSSVTAHSDFEFFDSFETSHESTEASHSSKRQRTSSGSFLVMSTVSESDAEGSATGSSEQGSEAVHEDRDVSNNDSVVGLTGESATPEEEDSAAATTESASSVPVPTNRRGRKQSLTEDPSKIFACDLCNRRFRRQEHLKRHYRSLHTHDKPFNCHECGKKFSRSDNLAQHARTHGAGAMVMNVFDDADMMAAAAGGYMPHVMYPGHPGHPMAMGDDYSGMGRVLFQVAAEIPGSASEHSSDDSDGQKKKRKRMD